MDPWRLANQNEDHLEAYAGRWVAVLDGEVIAQGGTPEQAYQFAKKSRFRENPELVYIPMKSQLLQSTIFNEIRNILPDNIDIYVVGGVVRDALLGLASHDFDFAVEKDSLKIARKVANHFDGAYFPMDTQRGIGRVIISWEGEKAVLDFTLFRGRSLEEDLTNRDFTINAIAVRLGEEQVVFDPLGGINDLRKNRLVACKSSSMADDPIRILRAVRLAASLDLHIDPNTRKEMRANASMLQNVSPERLRDEIFRIFATGKTAVCIRALEIMNILEYVLPELLDCKDVEQTYPHIHDVWNHTLEAVRVLEILTNLLQPDYDSTLAENAALGYVQMRLGRFREQFASHLQQAIVPDRTIKSLLLLAALYHDTGKPVTGVKGEEGKIRFFGHEEISSERVSARGKKLNLSNDEILRLETITANHMRPSSLSRENILPSRRAVYRFFRDTGDAGVDICLLSIADILAAYGPTIPQDRWERHLDVIRILLEAWWEKPQEQIRPEPLIDGHELMSALGISSGPLVGELLESVKEAQVTGEVTVKDEALDYAREVLKLKTNRSG